MKLPAENSNITLAISFQKCIAKTYIDENNIKREGRSVFNHCYIVGKVASEILDIFPDFLRQDIFSLGSELIAAAHDIGKVSPAFQEKILRGTTGYQWNSLQELKNIDPELEKNWGGHAGVSQATVQAIKVGKYAPEILGQHHGYSPVVTNLATDKLFGGKAWQEERLKLVDQLKSVLQAEWPKIENENQALAIAGLTSVSDWIGSGPFFENPSSPWKENIKAALHNAGFIKPNIRPDLAFEDIFGFSPHNAQTKLIENVNGAGVYILEAPMGLGKTEAALYAAYKMLANGQATGLYFALPTQLTSNKIHDRVNQFLKKILANDSHHQQSLLLHGNAWLKEMGEEGQPGGAWFNNSKRGILAPFAVGTIDQALMSVMNVKHGFVRSFGLTGKVVILDEVHTYDAYTGTLLDALVRQLTALHCTVIILSATLTKERREKFTQKKSIEIAYPLITALGRNAESLNEVEVEKIPDATVAISMLPTEQSAIDEVFLRAEQGQQVLWIENTVAEAQRIYALLAAKTAEMHIDCGLLHSRFLKVDRDSNEQKWVNLFGKNNVAERGSCGRILVGTQVLEQSLDIDADFLVTRFCPTDMLFQRIGRLWRHKNTVRPSKARREAWLLAPELDTAIENPEKAFGNTAWVYSPYVLCRSLEVWQKVTSVILPSDIRAFIEATYQARSEQGAMQNWYHELHEGSRKRIGIKQLESVALQGMSKGGKTLSENKATTRYSEQDTGECLLLKAVKNSDDKKSTIITLLNGEEIYLPKNGKQLDKKIWRELAAKIALNTVAIVDYLAPDALPIKQVAWLKDYMYLGGQYAEKSKICIGLVKESGKVEGLNAGTASAKYELAYDNHQGYQAKKKNKEDE